MRCCKTSAGQPSNNATSQHVLSMMYKVTNKLAKAQSPELKFKQHSWLSHGHDQRYRQHSSRTEHRRTSLFPGTGRDGNSLSKRQSRSPSLTPSSGGCQASTSEPTFLSFLIFFFSAVSTLFFQGISAVLSPSSATPKNSHNVLPVDLECTKEEEEGPQWGSSQGHRNKRLTVQ